MNNIDFLYELRHNCNLFEIADVSSRTGIKEEWVEILSVNH